MSADVIQLRRVDPQRALASERYRLHLDLTMAWEAVKLAHGTMCAAENPITQALYLAASERHERCFNAWKAAGAHVPPDGAA